MGAHEQLESILSWSPRKKVLIGLGIFAVIAVICALLIGIGYMSAKSRAEAERTKQDDRIAVLEANERQLAAENSLLKKQNEAAAAALKASDSTRTTANEKAFADLLLQRTKRYDQIDVDSDYDSQLCGLCADGTSSGYPEFSFCGRCKAVP